MKNKPFGSASGSRVPCHARSIGKKIAKLVILIVIVCNTICHNILLPLHCFHRNVVVHRYQIPHRCHCFILHIFRCRRFNCIFCLFRDSFKHVFFYFSWLLHLCTIIDHIFRILSIRRFSIVDTNE